MLRGRCTQCEWPRPRLRQLADFLSVNEWVLRFILVLVIFLGVFCGFLHRGACERRLGLYIQLPAFLGGVGLPGRREAGLQVVPDPFWGDGGAGEGPAADAPDLAFPAEDEEVQFRPVGGGAEAYVEEDVEDHCCDQEYGDGLFEWLAPPGGPVHGGEAAAGLDGQHPIAEEAGDGGLGSAGRASGLGDHQRRQGGIEPSGGGGALLATLRIHRRQLRTLRSRGRRPRCGRGTCAP